MLSPQYRLQARNNQSLTKYDAVLVASTHMLLEIGKHGVENSKLHHLPYPLTDFYPDLDTPIHKVPEGRITYVGRPTELKGIGNLLSAIPLAQKSLVIPLRITVAGSGPDEGRLRNLAARLGLEASFVGWINPESGMVLMRNSDLLAVPSLWPEPYGLVGEEASCFGVPAVGYEVGGIPDWLVSGETGEFAPGRPPTIRGLSNAIVGALKSPEH